MKYRLNLKKKWKSFNNLLIYGNPIDSTGNPIDLLYIDKVLETADNDSVYSIINQVYGHFSMIHVSDRIILIQDSIRSFPLFYSIKNSTLELYDELNFGSEKIDYTQLEFFKAACYISGSKTMFQGINQVLPGEVIFFEVNNDIVNKSSFFHFDFFRNFSNDNNEQMLYSRLEIILQNIFQRFKNVASNHQIVVPLSGGHDSRLILYYLKDIGLKNVITYTYGGKKASQNEKKNAEIIANALGFKFYYIPYERKKILKEIKTTNYLDLLKYASSISSFPHLQDWYAIKFLLDNKIIDNDSIVVPGHSGDFVSGSHIIGKHLESIIYSMNDVCKCIMNKHMYHYVWKNKNLYDVFKKEILYSIEAMKITPPFNNYEVIAIMDKYNFRERQSKMIINSVRIYEWFNLKWYLPLWDRDFSTFWLSLSVDNLFGRHFFLYFAKKKYGELMQIAPIVIKKPIYDFNDLTIRKSRLQNALNTMRILLKFLFFRSKIDKLALLEHFKLSEIIKYIIIYQTTNQDFIWLNHLLEQLDIMKGSK